MKDSLIYWVWISSIPALGSVRGRKLLDCFGTPEEVWHANRQSLLRVPDLGPVLVDRILDASFRTAAEKHLKDMEKYKIDAVSIVSPEYPVLLKEIYDPPLVLYKRGNFAVQKCIAVVGSRRASDYGLSVAKRLAGDLARCGVNVVSGLARGIDSKAHEGALEASGATAAVLGCGVDIVYPPENARLFDKIVSSGAILSEHLPGSPPLSGNFPARNRIISGLCSGVVVIEANEKSGSLITANFALEQGREVFAVPGNIVNTNSRGTNKLIREGAKIVTCVEDILDEINFYEDSVNCKKSQSRPIQNEFSVLLENLDDDERKIITTLMDGELHIDALSQRTGIDVGTLSSLLIMLELAGTVEQQPGKKFKIKNGI